MSQISQPGHHRLAAVAAVVGGVLLLAGTLLHPMGADPNDPAAAFAEYAADPWWRASHLTQLAGVTIAAAVLQAVDGVALKSMVDRWASAVEPDKLIRFEAAVAVRQIEIGLASMMSLLFGATFVVYGIAVLAEPHFRTRLAWLGVIGGGGLLISGTVMAYTGFSSLAMNSSMASTALLLLWFAALAISLWRSSPMTRPRA